jgi:hypothetical protein
MSENIPEEILLETDVELINLKKRVKALEENNNS